MHSLIHNYLDMKNSKTLTDWVLVPATHQQIADARKKCRRLVIRRAAISAGVSAVPIPGIDIATDLGLLARMIEEINEEFGLTPDQILRMHPKMRLVAYEMMVGMGTILVGKLVTRELVAMLLQRTGMKMMTKQASKFVPVAGQIVSAAIGFTAFRTIGNQHVDACAEIAAELLMVGIKPVS